MPKYGLNKYSRFKYGKYKMSSGGDGGSGLGPYTQYRVRTIDSQGAKTPFVAMSKNKITISSKEKVNTRIRANNGEWVRVQNETLEGETIKVRIRSIESDGGKSPWVYGDKGSLS
ncbi:hypothetical protein QO179_24545 [Bacillus stercoris]|nr:hypothetical protein [Bacillus stercoris]